MSTREPFAWHGRIRFVDTDASGRIHYSALFRHLETAEEEFMRAIGIAYGLREPADLSYPRVHVEADYLASLRHDDEIAVTVEVAKLGASSYTLQFLVYSEDTSDLAARGLITAVCMSRRTQKAHPLPDPVREALRPHCRT